jgi:hypothetical protein
VVNVNKTAPYYYGDLVELTAVPNDGWSLSYLDGRSNWQPKPSNHNNE